MRSLNSPRVHERKLGYQQVCCCAVEDDNALEHLNRAMKVSGGLVVITHNERAPPKFFLTDPELAKLQSWTKLLRKLPSWGSFFLNFVADPFFPPPLPLEAVLLGLQKKAGSLSICRKQL